MLKSIGVDSVDQLMDQTVPSAIRLRKEEAFKHQGKEMNGIHSETMMLAHLRDFANSNHVFKSYQGTATSLLLVLCLLLYI